LLYDYNSIQSCNFHFNDGSSTTNVTTYNLFGQDTLISGQVNTINWGAQQSTFTDAIETRSLFNNYYLDYLTNIFTAKARIVKLKGILPISLLQSLKLNDRLIIRDKRYVINEMKVNLTTGDVDLALINDFRPVVNINLPVVPPGGGVVQVGAFLGNNKTAAGFEYPGSGGVVTLTADTLLNITIPANTSGFPTYSNIYRDYEVYATIYQDA
jgi:hypothetical protein